MRIIICPKGILDVAGKSKSYKIVGMSPIAGRGYIVVSDEDAKELVKLNDYEPVDISSYAGNPENLPSGLKEIIEKHLENIPVEELAEETQVESNTTVEVSHETSIPIPVFAPVVWTTSRDFNYPVTLTYNDVDGNPNSFIFTKDYTIRPCTWCRVKYWLRNKFRRNNRT